MVAASLCTALAAAKLVCIVGVPFSDVSFRAFTASPVEECISRAVCVPPCGFINVLVIKGLVLQGTAGSLSAG